MLVQFFARTLSWGMLLILLSSCSGSSSSPLALAPPLLESDSESSITGLTENGVVLLRNPIRRPLFAADIRIDIDEKPHLPQSFSLGEALFTQISTRLVPGKVSYAADFDSALIRLPNPLKLIIPLPDGLQVDLVRLSPTPSREERTSLIYTGDAPFITTLDLAILLATIQVSDPTAIEIANRANQLLGIPNLVTPQSLDPLPSPENANYVDEGTGILNTLDVAAVLASLQVGPVPAEIATRINQLVNSPGLVEVSEILAIPGPQIPSEFIVTTVADSGPGSLRQIMELANTTPGADTIIFAPAVRGGTITLQSQLPTLTDEVRIAGPGAADLILSGDNAHRVLDIAPATTVTIEAVTISNGQTPSTGSALEQSGAGIRNQGILTVRNSTISGNTSSSSGGGIYTYQGLVTLETVTLQENQAEFGGGLSTQLGGVIIDDSSIVVNIATSTGGGVYSYGGVRIRNSYVAGNIAASRGGGIYNSLNRSIEVVSSEISFNSAGTEGGGIFVSNNGSLLLVDNLIRGGNNDLRISPNVTLYSAENAPLACNDLDNGGGLQSPGGCPITGPLPTGPQIQVTTLEDVTNTDGRCSLREAIQAANSNTTSGTFGECAPGDPAGSIIDLRELTGTITLSSPLQAITAGTTATIVGDSPTVLTIDGNNSNRVLQINAGATVTIEGVTIANGLANGSVGGGILNRGQLTVRHSVITGSTAALGGGIYTTGNASVMDTTIENNSATVFGGGLLNYAGLSTSLANITVSNNRSTNSGGGIFNFGTLIVLNSLIESNDTGNDGGGIANNYGASLTVTSSTFSGNAALSNGGGIFGNLTRNGNTFGVPQPNLSQNGVDNIYGGGVGSNNSPPSCDSGFC